MADDDLKDEEKIDPGSEDEEEVELKANEEEEEEEQAVEAA